MNGNLTQRPKHAKARFSIEALEAALERRIKFHLKSNEDPYNTATGTIQALNEVLSAIREAKGE